MSSSENRIIKDAKMSSNPVVIAMHEFDDFEENLPRAVVAAVEDCFQDAKDKGHPEYADTLIFASTEQEIRELQETLQKFGPRHTEILPLYARLALAEQQKILKSGYKLRHFCSEIYP